MRVGVHAVANRERGAYSAGADFVSFVSAATSPAHVDGARFVVVGSVGEGLGGARGKQLPRP